MHFIGSQLEEWQDFRTFDVVNAEHTHRFLIRLSNEGVSLSPELCMPLSCTNLPFESMRFRPHTEIFWQVSIFNYEKEHQRVQVDVVDYTPEDITGFYTQNPKSPITRVDFTGILWTGLLPHLSSYKKAAFNHLIIGEPSQINSQGIIRRTLDWHEKQNNRPVHLEFNVPFSKAQFVTGGVLVSKQIDTHQAELFIENSFILKEFELLKAYFAKALNKTKFYVKATVTIEDGKIKDAQASSPDIASIDESLLDTVRYLEAKTIRHTLPPASDKDLFSAEDLYGHQNEDEQRQSGIQLMEIILRDEQIRNKQHILYLAGQLHQAGEKILFTAHPNFGFVFHVQGNIHRHFIWELLNSHATYIWTYDPAILSHKLALRKLEYALGMIRTQGRQVYRFEMLNDVSVSDLHFHAIRHDKVSSALIDSFPLWRAHLQERLI